MHRRDFLTGLGALLLLPVRAGADEAFGDRLAAAARARTGLPVTYDPAYRSIPYPMGDVPADRGVCTDLVIRAYRAVGLDLQRLVHEDMREAFSSYPDRWGLTRPDPNIDHRRVPNLRVFFTRKGRRLAAGRDPADYAPGDIVTWTVGGNRPHIGVVLKDRAGDGVRPLIAHNIGRGPEAEDMLFAFPITGQYRYSG